MTSATMFGRICRACLGYNDDEIYSFHTRCILTGPNVSNSFISDTEGVLISDLILAVVKNLKMCPDLPELLCGSCLKELIQAKAFLEKFSRSEDALQNLLVVRGAVTQMNSTDFHVSTDCEKKEKETALQVTATQKQELNVVVPATQLSDDEWTGEDDRLQGRESQQEATPTSDLLIESLPEKEDLPPSSRRRSAKPGTKCPDCGVLFVHTKSLIRHQQKCHSDRTEEPEAPNSSVICEICNATFSSKKALLSHAKNRRCTKRATLGCPVCKREFLRQNALVSHLDLHKSHAVDTSLLSCPICLRQDGEETLAPYPSVLALKNHLEEHKATSVGTVNHVCTECGRCFKMFSTLKDHLRTHSGDKPFVCPICGRGFSQSTNLKQHLNRHNKVKSFQCTSCPASFVSKGELDSHTRVHSKAHPFVCECGTSFTTSTSLMKHRRRHTGDKPYSCKDPDCSMRFATLNSLKSHLRTMHRDTVTNDK